MSGKVIETGIDKVVETLDELCEHYRVRIHPSLSDEIIERTKARICQLELAKEAVQRLEPKCLNVDGRCRLCDEKLSEYEIKKNFYCPKCGQALINPEKHAEIIEEV